MENARYFLKWDREMSETDQLPEKKIAIIKESYC